MQAIELTGPSLDSLRAVTLPEPQPGPGEVLVRMRAASLNFVDLAAATGRYPVPRFPVIPVADGAGEVAALGAGVTEFHVGERVIPHSKPLWVGGPARAGISGATRGVVLPGSLAEYVVLPATALVRTPAHLTDAAAATLPIAATTAWRGLRLADVRPGSVVVLIGTGGVSVTALLLAKAAGATVIITSSSDEKLERARALGADYTINYRSTPAWDEAVLEMTGGNGADLVVETGGTQTFGRSINAAALGGTVFVIGFVTGMTASADLFAIMKKELRVQGVSTGSVADLRDVVRAVAASRIMPVVDKTFGIDETPQAYAYLAQGGQHFGKIVITHAAR
ncbi:zinc-dependent alcohol dehydrogenase family protein [Trinickia soli]|uniref:NAD(P)-dependent alcohol dehydrogenase n=1 Tax=Trinickia soli TaxID=380675 RepID=A0A2N7WEI7_9BURK|nr:NAD(P)-dependent alcohol dehydrogenase [Trinickia soli]KAA0082179.1 NAD(P)-dependent alcohol dehydrogenase [Paraburkholderia sp. T12-10]PMS27838.1 NAD(P)-dependent alcohol dehydrogenase [Trinickia soli]CAB3655820.1 Alcohol dehydrogenase [Trinickia soli]